MIAESHGRIASAATKVGMDRDIGTGGRLKWWKAVIEERISVFDEGTVQLVERYH